MVINRSLSRLYPSSPWTSLLGGEEEQRDGVRVIEDASVVLVSCWLPGFIQDDISVVFRNKQLKITAIRSAGSSEQLDVGVSKQAPMFDAMVFRDCAHDYSRESFYHTLSIDGPIDESAVCFLYESHELKVWLPRSAKLVSAG